MKKQALIKTLLILLSFFMLTLFLAFVMMHIPTHMILPIFGAILIGIIFHAIYKVILNDMEFKEKMLEREQEWKRIDAERYARKMTQDDNKF